MLLCLEKRGYVKAGAWTPEATVEHPEAGNDIFVVLKSMKNTIKKTIQVIQRSLH